MIGDNEYWTTVNGKLITVPPIDKLCDSLREKFLRQDEDNKRLEEENKKLKEGIWEKEEVKKYKEEYERMCIEYYSYGFPISKEEHDAIDAWISKRQKKYTGAIGGRYEYRFFPTGIGVIGKIVDCTNNDEFVFSELD